MSEMKDHFYISKIKKFYGITKSLINCGYILPDGTMLSHCDSSTGAVKEHFLVYKFYKGQICDCEIDSNYTVNCERKEFCKYSPRKRFIYYGGIRCIPNIGIIQLACIKNKSRKVLKELLEHIIFYNNMEVKMEVNKFNNIEIDGIEQLIFIRSVNYTIDKDADISDILGRVNRIYDSHE